MKDMLTGESFASLGMSYPWVRQSLEGQRDPEMSENQNTKPWKTQLLHVDSHTFALESTDSRPQTPTVKVILISPHSCQEVLQPLIQTNRSWKGNAEVMISALQCLGFKSFKEAPRGFGKVEWVSANYFQTQYALEGSAGVSAFFKKL